MSSDEEECYGYYWNNWKIPDEEDSTSEDKTSKISFHDGNEISISKINYGPEFGNWIPPLHLSNRSKNTSLRKLALNRSLQRNKNAAQVAFVNTQSRKYIDSAQQHNLNSTLKNDLKWEKILNCDWGERVELHDMTNFSDGDLMWGVVALGTFGKSTCFAFFINGIYKLIF